MDSLNGLEVAIVGISCRTPGAENRRQFWDLLLRGESAITTLDKSRIHYSQKHLLSQDNFVAAQGILEHPYGFDAEFFGMSEQEAMISDPQLRLLLSEVWSALQDASIDPQGFAGLIGLFAGAKENNYWNQLLERSGVTAGKPYEFCEPLRNRDYFASHVAWRLNLRGPAVMANSTCSTSLMTVALGCQSLLNGECDAAVAGGVNLPLPDYTGYVFDEGMVYSSDGSTRPFTREAQGTCSSTGAGFVVLKRLDDAIQAGDHIYALIKGVGINNDGANKVGYAAPSVDGQKAAVEYALATAGIDPGQIAFIETHGTATAIGDQIEFSALREVYGQSRRTPVPLGSVKSNIGHLSVAAGVAGLIKAALCLKHRLFVRNAHLGTPNPLLEMERHGFCLPVDHVPLDKTGTLFAAVSSFGLGGTNVHAILQSFEEPALTQGQPTLPQVAVFSGRSPETLDQHLAAVKDSLLETDDLVVIAANLQAHQPLLAYRQGFIADHTAALMAAMQKAAPSTESNRAAFENCEVVFCFPGGGSEYAGMGFGLYQSNARYRQIFDECLTLIERHVDYDLKAILFAPASDALRETRVAQVATFAVEYSLATLLKECGVKVTFLIGHSTGEVVSACVAGALPLQDAIALICARSQAMHKAPAGRMLGAYASASTVGPLLPAGAFVSADNSSRLCTISTSTESFEACRAILDGQSIEFQDVRAKHPFHTPLMESVVADFLPIFASIRIQAPTIPYISNVTGDFARFEHISQPEYWQAQLTGTVRFREGITTLLNRPKKLIFLELGPGNVLRTFLNGHENFNADKHQVINALRHPKADVNDVFVLQEQLLAAWKMGLNLDWAAFNRSFYCEGQIGPRKLALPVTPLLQTPYMLDDGDPATRTAASERKLESDWIQDSSRWTYAPLWKEVLLEGPSTPEETPLHVVITTDDHVWTAFARKLGSQAFRVNPQGRWERTAEGYLIDEKNEDHFGNVFVALKIMGLRPSKIVWILSENKLDIGQQAFDALTTLQFIVSGLRDTFADCTTQVYSVAHGLFCFQAHETLQPGLGSLITGGLVAGQEHRFVQFHAIDPGYEVKDQIDALLDLMRAHACPRQLALRFGKVWTQEYEPLAARPESKFQSHTIPSHAAKVYIITGGLGRLGLTFAEYLSSIPNVRICLSSRMHTELNSTQSAALKRMRSNGATVDLFRCDVTQEDDVHRLAAFVRENLGPVAGLWHAAGDMTDSAFEDILSIDRKTFMKALDVKLKGLQNLIGAFEDQGFGFLALTSSISTVLGGLRYGAYATANLIADRYLEQLRSRHRLLSVRWDAWNLDDVKHKYGIDRDEGRKVFSNVLEHNPALRHVLVSTGSLQQRLTQWVDDLAAPKVAVSNHAQAKKRSKRPLQDVDYLQPSNERQKILATVWAEYLALDQIGVKDSLSDLGASSLEIVQVRSILSAKYKLDISLAAMMTCPTIESLDLFMRSRETSVSPAESAPANRCVRDDRIAALRNKRQGSLQ